MIFIIHLIIFINGFISGLFSGLVIYLAAMRYNKYLAKVRIYKMYRAK